MCLFFFFFKPQSVFRRRLNIAGTVWGEWTWFIPHLSPPRPGSADASQPSPMQWWQYLGISAGLGNPARMDSLSSLNNKWRVRTAPTSPRRKPGSTGWSTLPKKMKGKSDFSSKAAWWSLHGWDCPSSSGHLLSTLGPREVFPAKGLVF